METPKRCWNLTVCVCVCVRAWTSVCLSVCRLACLSVCLCVSVYVSMCVVYVCIWVCGVRSVYMFEFHVEHIQWCKRTSICKLYGRVQVQKPCVASVDLCLSTGAIENHQTTTTLLCGTDFIFKGYKNQLGKSNKPWYLRAVNDMAIFFYFLFFGTRCCDLRAFFS